MFRNTVLPVLMGVAAVTLSIASVVVIVTQLRDHDDGGDARNLAALAGRFDAPGAAVPDFQFRGRIDQTYLGVSVEEQNGALAVRTVVGGSPAATAGLKVGDTISTVNGTAVTSVQQLRDILDRVESGKKYAVDVTRDGQKQSVQVQQTTYAQAFGGRGSGGFGDFHRSATPTATPAAGGGA